MPNNQLVFAEIAAGNCERTGAAPGDKLQGAQGCTVVAGTTGLLQVTLSPPNDGLAAADLIITHNPGFGTSKGGGGMSTSLSSLSSGTFIITLWDQTTVPPVAIDGNVHFRVTRKYQNQ